MSEHAPLYQNAAPRAAYFDHLSSTGLLWLVNRLVFNPRGFTLAEIRHVASPDVATDKDGEYRLAGYKLYAGVEDWPEESHERNSAKCDHLFEAILDKNDPEDHICIDPFNDTKPEGTLMIPLARGSTHRATMSSGTDNETITLECFLPYPAQSTPLMHMTPDEAERIGQSILDNAKKVREQIEQRKAAENAKAAETDKV